MSYPKFKIDIECSTIKKRTLQNELIRDFSKYIEKDDRLLLMLRRLFRIISSCSKALKRFLFIFKSS